MADYSKGQDFAALKGEAGDPTILNTEFNLVVAASATKADKASPTFTGTVVVPALSAAVSHTGDGAKTSPIQSREVYMHAFATGVKMAFFQASAPLGWTQDATNNDALLRVVSGGGGGTGGTDSPVTGLSTTDAFILLATHLPAHKHAFYGYASPGVSTGLTTGAAPGNIALNTSTTTNDLSAAMDDTGGDTGHSHAITFAPKYVDMIICTKD